MKLTNEMIAAGSEALHNASVCGDGIPDTVRQVFIAMTSAVKKTVDNSDTPSVPYTWKSIANGQVIHNHSLGITKREQFCLAMGVPETGDPVLDDIIRKGNRLEVAKSIAQGMATKQSMHAGTMALSATTFADLLIEVAENPDV
jgi:hypothetical protein